MAFLHFCNVEFFLVFALLLLKFFLVEVIQKIFEVKSYIPKFYHISMARLKDKINRLSKGKDEYKMKYDLTKNQNEVAIEKLEISQETLKKSNLLLIRNLTRNLMKSKQEVNDLKFTQICRENKIKDLEERFEGTIVMKKGFEKRFEEISTMNDEQSLIIVKLQNQLQSLKKLSKSASENNTKLEEEITTLKEDYVPYLEHTVQELEAKLLSKDEELKKRELEIAFQKEELNHKTIQHEETLNQLKKLTQHLPETALQKKIKKPTSILLAPFFCRKS